MKNMKKYNKLVRDKIPAIIRSHGSSCKTRTAKPEEIMSYYRKKIDEELDELFEDPSAEEMADVMEAVDALREKLGFSIDEVISAKSAKRETRGGFRNATILIHVEE
jgi:predicted house-cleaning noncanonical NTP pyrophosphatase (MazG superfamily)